MEATEMMLGDWYMWYAENKYYYHRVERYCFKSLNHLNYYPVPLTKEILERNANGGFGYYDNESRATYRIHCGEESVSVCVE